MHGNSNIKNLQTFFDLVENLQARWPCERRSKKRYLDLHLMEENKSWGFQKTVFKRETESKEEWVM